MEQKNFLEILAIFAVHQTAPIMRILIPLLLTCTLIIQAAEKKNSPEKNPLTTLCNKDILKEKLCQPQAFTPVPKVGDSYWNDSIPENMRNSYIHLAEQFLDHSWATMPATIFSEFRTNGNRVNFEQLSFQKRKQLAILVMGEIMEDKGRFMPDIINGLWSICEETWWGIPAHYGPKIPIPGDQTVDLFNAETAGLMAWSNYMLREKLRTFSPLVSKRIDQEIERRILLPALENKYWWKTAGMNWNPWICSNWLSCVLLSETDRERQLKGVEAILECLDHFINAYPEDGGCDEGPGYWDRAAASLSENLIMLRQATNGIINLSEIPKIKNMGDFVYKTYIGNGYAVNFADASNHATQDINAIYPFALYIQDPVMAQYAAFIAHEKKYFTTPATLYEHCGNYPGVARELRLLSELNSLRSEKPKEALIAGAWLPDLQVMTSRSIEGSTKGFYLAAKGGHNGESHNHNDVGNFIVYYNGEPLLIDVGVGTYTAQTFSGGRYGIWTMQSGYHNLPKINGIDQKDGKQYKARNVNYKNNGKRVTFSLDIAGAYPEDAKVENWIRTFRFERNKRIDITEEYRLKECIAPTEIILLTCGEPQLTKEGIVLTGKGGNCTLILNENLTPSIETIQIDDSKLRKSWGDRIWRIHLKIQSTSPIGNLKYSLIQ